jgi:glycosyltransferase involved in cell wall biosynthesis
MSASPGPVDAGQPAAGLVGVVVPAKDEAPRIGATVAALVASPGVAAVVVVDDGSSDDTSTRARAAGADVVRHSRNRGKGAALETGAARLSVLQAARTAADASPGPAGEAPAAQPWPLLFVDADLAGTSANALVLAGPVLAGEADLAIAVLPPQARAGGGRGFVVRLARRGIVRATGWTPTQPLSGMRCLTREAFEAARPLARGWGVETAMTIDLLAAGYRVVEVPCDLQHRVTGSDLRGQVHRLRQYRDVARGLAVRRARRAAPLALLRRLPRRGGPRPRS